jgi:iron(III) transport system permease protein
VIAEQASATHKKRFGWPAHGTFIVAALILSFGFYILYPITLIFVNSFNISAISEPAQYSLENWRLAFTEPGIWQALRNTILIFVTYTAIGFPVAVLIAWVLARTDVRFSHTLEFLFWVSFMLPPLATTIGWTFLLGPYNGLMNRAWEALPLTDGPFFNIYSFQGIVLAHLMANNISIKVMLLTPAFRNMNMALEEAGRVSGATNLRTMLRVTFPIMAPAMVIVFMLGTLRLFQSFETEQLLGAPGGFFVYSTKIFSMIRAEPPETGQATALASLTLLVIAVIIPLQHWVSTRRQYTTVSSGFRPGLIKLGKWGPLVFGLVAGIAFLLTALPILTLVGGSLMTRVGFFEIDPMFTLNHWRVVLGDRFFMEALRTTLILSGITALVSPLLFSVVGYILARTRWRGRGLLDSLLWSSSAIPGILASLGLMWAFLRTPGLEWMFGTIWALLVVTILQSQLLSTQLAKGAYLQIGLDMEEAARVSGAGWLRTYFKIWLPLIAPTMVLIGVINFVASAQATANIILIADRDTTTLSILALQMMTNDDVKLLEEAGIVSIVLIGITLVAALTARKFGLRMGVQHR